MENIVARAIKPRLLSTSVISSGCAVLLAISSMASAQMAQDRQAATTAAPSATIEDIVVTAQRRTERLQSVPISAQVVSGQTLVAKNQNTLTSVAQTLPGVHLASNGASNDMYIRGIGSGGSQTFDQSVGTFIDGIYHGRSRNTAATFMDLDRIEVLKGPQTTFFGNNAIAGALNITSAKPTDSFSGYGRALFGGHGHYAAEAAVNVPLSNVFAIRAAGTLNGSSGWIEDIAQDRKVPVQRNYAGRVTLSFRPSDTFDAMLKLESSRSSQKGAAQSPFQIVNCPPPAPFVAAGPCLAALNQGIPIGLHQNKNSDGAHQGSWLRSSEATLALNYHLDALTISSLTGYYKYNFKYGVDADFTPQDLTAVGAPDKYHQFSQELRITSPQGEPIEYIAGAYYQNDHLRPTTYVIAPFANPIFSALPPFAPLVPYLPIGQKTLFDQKEKVYSAFGSVTWNATDKLKLTASIRGSWVKKNYVRTVSYGTALLDYSGVIDIPSLATQALAASVFGTPIGTVAGKRSDHGWQPAARIQYQFTPEIMAYASYTRGFKAGGFSAQDGSSTPETSIPFGPEHVNAYEVGLKSRLFGNKVLFNVAAFRTDYSDLQVTVNPQRFAASTIAVTRNAAKSRSQGVEIETQWAVTPELRLTVNGSYLDSHYVSYTNGGPTVLQKFLGETSQDLSGRPTEFAPKWSASVDATYRVPIADDYHFTFNVSPYLTSGYFISAQDDPNSRQPSYVRVDARISFDGPEDRWGIDLIAHNLTNTVIREISAAISTAPGSYSQNKQEPRYFAIQGRLKW